MTINGNLFGGHSPQRARIGPGQVMHGNGPPRPSVGEIGQPYIDDLTGELFVKRRHGQYSNWGFCLFIVPPAIAARVKWFGECINPDVSLGEELDYFLLWEHSLMPRLFGPKTSNTWPEDLVSLAGLTISINYNRVP